MSNVNILQQHLLLEFLIKSSTYETWAMNIQRHLNIILGAWVSFTLDWQWTAAEACDGRSVYSAQVLFALKTSPLLLQPFYYSYC
eukprot:scaffold104014_cov42-Prasinocladus_malaysianus.AAC.1